MGNQAVESKLRSRIQFSCPPPPTPRGTVDPNGSLMLTQDPVWLRVTVDLKARGLIKTTDLKRYLSL